MKKLPLTYWGHCAPHEPTLTFMFFPWLSFMSLPKTHTHTHTNKQYLAEQNFAAEHVILWNVTEGLFSFAIQILSDIIGYQFTPLVSKIYMEMCLVIPLRFSLHKLMVQSTALKGKLGEDHVHHAQTSLSPHKSIGSKAYLWQPKLYIWESTSLRH